MDFSTTHKQLKYDFVFAVGVALLGVLIGYIAAMYISKVSPSVIRWPLGLHPSQHGIRIQCEQPFFHID